MVWITYIVCFPQFPHSNWEKIIQISWTLYSNYKTVGQLNCHTTELSNYRSDPDLHNIRNAQFQNQVNFVPSNWWLYDVIVFTSPWHQSNAHDTESNTASGIDRLPWLKLISVEIRLHLVFRLTLHRDVAPMQISSRVASQQRLRKPARPTCNLYA